MKTKKVKWIDRWLFLSPYCIGLCRDEASFNKELERLKIPKEVWPKWVKGERSDATTHFFEKDDNRGLCCIVCIRKRKGIDSISIMGLLVHEAVHVWQAIKDEIGEKKPSDEFEAYTIQNISQRFFEAYREL